jgi:hypothetical protein
VTENFVKKITKIEQTALEANAAQMREEEANKKLEAAEVHSKKARNVNFILYCLG